MTVLATGFEGQLVRRASAAPASSQEEPGETPAAETTAAAETSPAVSAAFDQDAPTYNEDDADIPAFLRRRD